MTDPAEEPGELIGRGRAADIYPLAAVRDDHRPYLAPVAEIRLRDVNVRPAEAARLRRLSRDVSGRG